MFILKDVGSGIIVYFITVAISFAVAFLFDKNKQEKVIEKLACALYRCWLPVMKEQLKSSRILVGIVHLDTADDNDCEYLRSFAKYMAEASLSIGILLYTRLYDFSARNTNYAILLRYVLPYCVASLLIVYALRMDISGRRKANIIQFFLIGMLLIPSILINVNGVFEKPISTAYWYIMYCSVLYAFHWHIPYINQWMKNARIIRYSVYAAGIFVLLLIDGGLTELLVVVEFLSDAYLVLSSIGFCAWVFENEKNKLRAEVTVWTKSEQIRTTEPVIIERGGMIVILPRNESTLIWVRPDDVEEIKYSFREDEEQNKREKKGVYTLKGNTIGDFEQTDIRVDNWRWFRNKIKDRVEIRIVSQNKVQRMELTY